MKKITKLGVLSLALVALTTALFTKATPNVTKLVSLTLNHGSNSCVIDNYPFGSYDASVNDIDLTAISTGINCTFLENPQRWIHISLANLSDGTNTIASTGFTMSIAGANAVGQIDNLSAISTGLSTAEQVIYIKKVNVLGSWESTMTIDGTIPGGTPAGSYTGNLNLTIGTVAP